MTVKHIAQSLILSLVLILSSCGGRVGSRASVSWVAPSPNPEASTTSAALLAPDYERFTKQGAEKMDRAASGALAPVYAPMAREIVAACGLKDVKGVGVDVGGGPGSLAVELAKETTSMYWVNADINTAVFPIIARKASEAGVAHRVGSVFADSQALPFRDRYADAVVSRGSLQFWKDRRLAFSEILRVLKPEGVAYVGRGFASGMPVETARKVRKGQKGGPKYDVDQLEAELRQIMRDLKIADFQIIRHKPEGAGDITYGVWVRFRKECD